MNSVKHVSRNELGSKFDPRENESFVFSDWYIVFLKYDEIPVSPNDIKYENGEILQIWGLKLALWIHDHNWDTKLGK